MNKFNLNWDFDPLNMELDTLNNFLVMLKDGEVKKARWFGDNCNGHGDDTFRDHNNKIIPDENIIGICERKPSNQSVRRALTSFNISREEFRYDHDCLEYLYLNLTNKDKKNFCNNKI